MTGGSRLAYEPCGGCSLTGASALWTTGAAGFGGDSGVGLLTRLAPARALGGGVAGFFLAARTSLPTRDAAAAARKWRRFKSVLRMTGLGRNEKAVSLDTAPKHWLEL